MTTYSRRAFIQTIGLSIGASTGAFPLISLAEGKQRIPGEQKINIALCGLGRYATVLKRGLAVSQHCQLAGIITGTPAKIAQWKGEFSIPDIKRLLLSEFRSDCQ